MRNPLVKRLFYRRGCRLKDKFKMDKFQHLIYVNIVMNFTRTRIAQLGK
jgi:hypothetical protein